MSIYINMISLSSVKLYPTLVNILIAFFVLLFIYQILSSTFSYFKLFSKLQSLFRNFSTNTFREGLDDTASNVPTYTDYNQNDPLVLAKQNAGNIEYIKQRMDSLEKLPPIVDKLTTDMANLNEQMIALTQSQSDTMNSVNASATDSANGT